MKLYCVRALPGRYAGLYTYVRTATQPIRSQFSEYLNQYTINSVIRRLSLQVTLLEWLRALVRVFHGQYYDATL